MSEDKGSEHHEGLIVLLLNTFLNTNPGFRYLHDDLKSEAQLAVLRVMKRNTDNTLLAVHIRAAFTDCVANDQTIFVSKSSRSRHKDNPDVTLDWNRAGTAEWEHTAEQDGLRDPRTMVDLWDEVLGACETQVDRTIVEMRRDGYKDKEIADHLGTKQSSVQYLRKKIEERFKARQTA